MFLKANIYVYTQLRKQLFKQFHATRQNIIKIMLLIKVQEYFEKMYSCSGAFTLSLHRKQISQFTLSAMFKHSEYLTNVFH